jgi:hypothetical protein
MGTAATMPNFNDMGGHGIMPTGIKSVVTLDDVRSHWSSKEI